MAAEAELTARYGDRLRAELLFRQAADMATAPAERKALLDRAARCRKPEIRTSCRASRPGPPSGDESDNVEVMHAAFAEDATGGNGAITRPGAIKTTCLSAAGWGNRRYRGP